jgi:hypothetical protein
VVTVTKKVVGDVLCVFVRRSHWAAVQPCGAVTLPAVHLCGVSCSSPSNPDTVPDLVPDRVLGHIKRVKCNEVQTLTEVSVSSVWLTSSTQIVG